jgi:hypothetical protein
VSLLLVVAPQIYKVSSLLTLLSIMVNAFMADYQINGPAICSRITEVQILEVRIFNSRNRKQLATFKFPKALHKCCPNTVFNSVITYRKICQFLTYAV